MIEPEDIERLYKKTITAIIVIESAYILGIAAFIAMFLLGIRYSYVALIFPLMGYLWLISLGAKYVNNRYGFKKTSEGTIVYTKRHQNYATSIVIHMVIFLFASIIRLVYETKNLLLIRRELSKVSDL